MSVPDGYGTDFGNRDCGVVVVAPPSDPMAVARLFISGRYMDALGVLLLRHHRGGFYGWNGSCWPEAEGLKIRADLYRWLEDAFYWKASKTTPPELVPF